MGVIDHSSNLSLRLVTGRTVMSGMKRVGCALVFLVGFAACSSGPIGTRADNAHLNASFACMSFGLVFPTTVDKKIALTTQQRYDLMTPAVGSARNAAYEDNKWSAESRAFDALGGNGNPAAS
jgi:hypothetical protein